MIIHWSPNPIIFSLGPLEIRWYSLGFLIGFFSSFLLVKWMCLKEGKDVKKLDSLLNHTILGTIIGARLGHCFFYEPAYFFQHPLEIFAIWNGGLASHGGAIGLLLSLFLFWRKNKDLSLGWIFDRVAIVTSLTGGFIRLGNLMNSEIFGKATQSNWGFVFDCVDQIPRHPTQIYEALCYFSIALVGGSLYYKFKKNPPPFFIFGIIVSLIFLCRFFLEFLKENQEAFEGDMLINMGQVLSIPFILLGILIASYSILKKYNIIKP